MRLKEMFLQLNRGHFHGRLPLDTVVKWDEKKTRGRLGRCHVHGITRCTIKGCKHSYIWLNPRMKWSKSITRTTLVHESVHLELGLQGKDKYDHGRDWQKRMKQLANRGAFKNIW